MSTRWLWLAVPALLYLLWTRSVTFPPGVVVAEEPRQEAVQGLAAWQQQGFTLQPLATYQIRARLLGREPYWVDAVAKLAPVDLAVGWGPMSDQAVLDNLSWSQGHRFWQYQPWRKEWPIPIEEVNSHSANMHIIPATSGILSAIRMTRTGSIVRLSGMLIEATYPGNPKPWRSSLSRTDSGAGACEIMWVNEFVRE
jgi:hypothetical protein